MKFNEIKMSAYFFGCDCSHSQGVTNHLGVEYVFIGIS